MPELTLYDYELDEQCYKVRLLLGVLGHPHKKVPVDVHPGREHRSTRYLRLNPLGTLPILTEGDAVLYGAEAILAYLARKYDTMRAWLPDEPTTFGQVMQWLVFAVSDLRVASVARSHSLMGMEADEAIVERAARYAFRHMDDHMTKCEFDGAVWFVGQAPTIADIALFPAFALSRDFGVDHDEFPALRRWMARIRKIPGFVTMPGIPAYH
ncbi:MAG: glutathione S-transferase family protein [Bradyrhizobiaceae bacterium]|nr:glutathione S-transferase family protein [Bradyrhizobiaceae bacterium]